MKISGGEMRGRKISRRGAKGGSEHGDLRATSAKVRESVFNILAGQVKDSTFLDLYAGTGAVGMDAMSRGAAKIYFVEAEKKRAEAIRDTLEGCGCQIKAVVVCSKALDFIRRSVSSEETFDIVFLDPPYFSEEAGEALRLLGEGTALSSEGVVLAEHSSKREMPGREGRLVKKKSYRYGDTTLTLYRKEP